VLLAGTALVSFSSLLLEVALTRLFSVVLYYHFAFLAISVAMLGLGAGGVFAYLRRDWLERWELRRLASVICALSAGAVVVALWVALHMRVQLTLESGNFIRLTAIYLTAAIPFFYTGLLLALVFARRGQQITQLYGADLAGGGLACLAAVPLLNTLGAPNAVICAALAMMVAAGVWADAGTWRKIAMGMSGLLLALIVVNHAQKLIDVVYAKGRFAQTGSEFAQWNAISRIEVTNSNGQYAGKWANIDSDAATFVVSADPRDPNVLSSVREQGGVSALANLLRPKGDYAIIGPGGGTDVLGAVAAGSPNVVGIEINPIIATTIMRQRYADYTHHLYGLPQVHIQVSDGRSWLRGSHEKYDVIQMTLVDTWASTAAGAFALSENNLYTVEAFSEYFDHLKSDGLITITRWEFAQPREALRVVSQALEVLRQRGLEDARKHFMVVADEEPNEKGKQVAVLVKKTPFTIEEERTVLARVQAAPSFYPLYTPYVYGRLEESAACGSFAAGDPHAGCIDASLAVLAESRKAPRETVEPFQQLIALPWHAIAGPDFSPRSNFIRDYPFNIAPVTDNAPFFFFTFKTGTALRALLTRGGLISTDWKNNLGLVILGMILAISLVAVVAFLIGPLALHPAQKTAMMPLLYFVAIGLGYILAEIALIQRFVLFLGHPTYALTVVVFLMLLSSGAGSVASKHWLQETASVRRVLVAIAGVVMVYVALLHRLLGSLVALPFIGKLLLSALLLVPLGFLMGMPFPTGLRAMATAERTTATEWAWALNAASSVLGSVLAIVVSINFGLDATLGSAAGAYLSAMALSLYWRAPSVGQVSVESPEPVVSSLA